MKSSFKKIEFWSWPAYSSLRRVSCDVDMAKEGNVPPSRRFTRLKKDLEMAKDARNDCVEEIVEDVEENFADITGSSTLEW